LNKITIYLERLKSLKSEVSIEDLSKKWNVEYSSAMRYVRKLGRLGFVEGRVDSKKEEEETIMSIS